MDSARIGEIMESHGVIEVKYQNSPVWIEGLRVNGMADVTLLATDERLEVPVEELDEGEAMVLPGDLKAGS